MGLMDELGKERKNIKTDSYDMSIGEIISLYQDWFYVNFPNPRMFSEYGR